MNPRRKQAPHLKRSQRYQEDFERVFNDQMPVAKMEKKWPNAGDTTHPRTASRRRQRQPPDQRPIGAPIKPVADGGTALVMKLPAGHDVNTCITWRLEDRRKIRGVEISFVMFADADGRPAARNWRLAAIDRRRNNRGRQVWRRRNKPCRSRDQDSRRPTHAVEHRA